MPKFYVYSTETVFYTTVVDAETKDEAMDKVRWGEVETGEPDDGQDFEVTGADLVVDITPQEIKG